MAGFRGRLLAGFVIAALFGAGLVIGKNVLIGPAKTRLGYVKQEQEVERRKGESLARAVQMERKVIEYRAELLEKADASLFLESLNRMAEESGVSLTSVTPLSTEDIGMGYIKLPIQIEMRCRYHHVGRFLSKVESSKLFVKVESLRIEDRPEVTSQDWLAVSITLNGFARSSTL